MAPSRQAVERGLARLLQGALLVILAWGVLERNLSVAVNALLAFLVTLLPAVLRRDYSIRLDPGLALFVTAAVFLHSLGMVGLYDSIWWWDHLTHTLSAMIVAGVGYTVVRAFDEHSPAFEIPERHLPLYIVGVTLAMGLLWEGLELGARVGTNALGLDVIWVHYGPNDTLLDLVFDAVGALVVALFGTRRLQSEVDSLRAWFDRRIEVE